MEYHQPTRKLYPIRQLVHADAIDINAGNVTLDLNGFSILDALVCSTGSRSHFHFKNSTAHSEFLAPATQVEVWKHSFP